MSSNLRILALEPYFDGYRKAVLQSIVRRSRHEWTLLKLPARRVERRLAAASRWFGEVIERNHLASHVDLLVTGEMLNLRDLIRCVPKLGRAPSVVYFHDNQLPAIDDATGGPLELVNLNTAMAATEVWFNSQWHLDDFLERCEAVVERHPELHGRHPSSEIRAKCQVLLPPTDFAQGVDLLSGAGPATRAPRTILIDTRGTDLPRLLRCLDELERQGEAFDLITVGPQRGLPDDLPRTVVHERDEANILRALQVAGVYLSLRHGATFDELLMPALSAGCWPVTPESGAFAEAIAPSMHEWCLHDGSVDAIVSALTEGMRNERPVGFLWEQDEILQGVDAMRVCRVIDDMLEEVAAGKGIGTL